MTVAELIEILKRQDQSAQVVLSDDTWDEVAVVSDVSVQSYDGHHNLGPVELTDELRNAGFAQSDVYERKVVVLW